MEIEFAKMEGIGNDFVLLDDRDGKIASRMPYPELAKKLCARHFSIGADGILLILDSKDHDIKFRIYNSDGSEPEMCGNGMRCFAKYLYEKKMVSKKKFRVDTLAGTVVPEVILDDAGRVASVRVDVGEPVLLCRDIPFESPKEMALDEPLAVGDREYRITTVSMGNPHAVIFVEDYKTLDLETEGRAIETHPRFPQKINVEFIQVLNRNELNMKVWERGAGITLACGTGACASLVAANLTGRADEKALIHLPGGDLEIFWDKATGHVFKTGPATLVFEGRVVI